MEDRYKIRPLRLADLDRVLEIERASFGKEAYDRNLFAEYLRKCGGLFLGAERGNRICGYMLTCFRVGNDRAEVISVAIEPSARGQGAASALMESTLRRLRRRHIARLGLMVKLTNAEARRFYEKYGFVRIRRVREYYEDGADGILMTKHL